MWMRRNYVFGFRKIEFIIVVDGFVSTMFGVTKREKEGGGQGGLYMALARLDVLTAWLSDIYLAPTPGVHDYVLLTLPTHLI